MKMSMKVVNGIHVVTITFGQESIISQSKDFMLACRGAFHIWNEIRKDIYAEAGVR